MFYTGSALTQTQTIHTNDTSGATWNSVSNRILGTTMDWRSQGTTDLISGQPALPPEPQLPWVGPSFALKTASIFHGMDSTCWKHSVKILVYVDMIVSHFCRFVILSDSKGVALDSTDSGDWGGH